MLNDKLCWFHKKMIVILHPPELGQQKLFKFRVRKVILILHLRGQMMSQHMQMQSIILNDNKPYWSQEMVIMILHRQVPEL